MSIHTRPKRLLLDSLTVDTLTVDGGVVTIQGLPPFLAADVVEGACFAVCPEDCTPQAVTITPTIPDGTCECPWAWQLTIEKKPCLSTYRVQETFSQYAHYDYQDPNQGTPTVAEIIDSIVLQINSDPWAIIEATAIGTPATAFTITEKDCDSDKATCGFNAFIRSGAFSGAVGHVAPILSASEMSREFAVLPGSFLQRPELAFCGTYCKYSFKVSPINKVRDPHLANAETDRYLNLEIYVNSGLANYAADWQTPLETAISCLTIV